MRIAVIGAGLAGLSFVTSLGGSDKADISVFEKSLGVGGRLATRRRDDFQFDHGAQFFTCRSNSLKELLSNQDTADSISEWQPKLVTLKADSKPFKRSWFEPHYVGSPTMTALPKMLASQCDVKLGTRVTRIDRVGTQWQLVGDNESSLGHYDWVVSAMPAPQATDLFSDRFEHAERLKSVEMSPCFALMLALRQMPKLNFGAAIVQESPIVWIADNSAKPNRPQNASLLVHSDNSWAKQHLEESLEFVEDKLLSALSDLIPIRPTDILHTSLHRWRYAKVELEAGENFLIDEKAGLATIGDWCRGNRAEDAFLSGAALADHFGSELLMR